MLDSEELPNPFLIIANSIIVSISYAILTYFLSGTDVSISHALKGAAYLFGYYYVIYFSYRWLDKFKGERFKKNSLFAKIMIPVFGILSFPAMFMDLFVVSPLEEKFT